MKKKQEKHANFPKLVNTVSFQMNELNQLFVNYSNHREVTASF